VNVVMPGEQLAANAGAALLDLEKLAEMVQGFVLKPRSRSAEFPPSLPFPPARSIGDQFTGLHEHQLRANLRVHVCPPNSVEPIRQLLLARRGSCARQRRTLLT